MFEIDGLRRYSTPERKRIMEGIDACLRHEPRRETNALLKRARRENVILRSPEGEEFILAEVGDFNREIELTRQNRALMKLLDARARQTETVSFEDVKGLLGLAVRGKSPGTDSRATG